MQNTRDFMPFRPAHLVHTDEAALAESTASEAQTGSDELGTRSSAGEQALHTRQVVGSIPTASTTSGPYFDWKAAGWDRDRDEALAEFPEEVRDLYFVLATETRRIKIGVAKDVRSRLHGMQTGSAEPLVLLGTIKTDDPWTFEAELHECWDCIRVRGEWFEAHPDLLKFIWEARDQRWEVLPEQPRVERPTIPDGIEAPAGNSRAARMQRYLLARGLTK